MQGLSSFGSFNPLTELPQSVAANGSAKTTALPAVGSGAVSSSSAGAAPAALTRIGAAGAGGGAALTASLLAEEELVSGYAMTVGHQQYAAAVEQSGGNYTASVENVTGGTATGSSELAAENNLQLRIDELV
jgi:hypothetical protein